MAEAVRFMDVFGPSVPRRTGLRVSADGDAQLRSLGGYKYASGADEGPIFDTAAAAVVEETEACGQDAGIVEGDLADAFRAPRKGDRELLPAALHGIQQMDWEEEVLWDDDGAELGSYGLAPPTEAENKARLWVNPPLAATTGGRVWFNPADKTVFLNVPRDEWVDVDSQLHRSTQSAPATDGQEGATLRKRDQRLLSAIEMQHRVEVIDRSLGSASAAAAPSALTRRKSALGGGGRALRQVHMQPVVHPIPARHHTSINPSMDPREKAFFHRPRLAPELLPSSRAPGNPQRWTLLTSEAEVTAALDPKQFGRSADGGMRAQMTGVNKASDLLLPLGDQAGHFVLMEHSDERPIIVGSVGMTSRLVLYSRRPEQTTISAFRRANRRLPRWRQFVRTVEPVRGNMRTPFLGEISDQAAYVNDMFKAPIFPHDAPHWFVLVAIEKANLTDRSRRRIGADAPLHNRAFAIKPLPRGAVFACGQQEPIEAFLMAQPSTPAHRDLEVKFCAFHLRRLFDDHIFRRRQNQRISAFVSLEDARNLCADAAPESVRLALQEIGQKIGSDTSESYGLAETAPQRLSLATRISPALVCALRSCAAAAGELRAFGATKAMVDPKAVAVALGTLHGLLTAARRRANIVKAHLRGSGRGCATGLRPGVEALVARLKTLRDGLARRHKVAQVVHLRLQLAPWAQSQVFQDARNAQKSQQYQMELYGVGDPSGLRKAFSYTRDYTQELSKVHGAAAKEAPAASGRGSRKAGTQGDLRSLEMKNVNPWLRKIGWSSQRIKEEARWTKINFLKHYANKNAHKPGMEGLKRFMRDIAPTGKKQYADYTERMQVIWDAQREALSDARPPHSAALSAAPPAQLSDLDIGSDSDESSSDSDSDASAQDAEDDASDAENDRSSGASTPLAPSPTPASTARRPQRAVMRLERRVYKDGREEVIVKFDTNDMDVRLGATRAAERRRDRKWRREPLQVFMPPPRAKRRGRGEEGDGLKIKGRAQRATLLKFNKRDMEEERRQKRKRKAEKKQEDREAYQRPRTAQPRRQARRKRPAVLLNVMLKDSVLATFDKAPEAALFHKPVLATMKREADKARYRSAVKKPICLKDMVLKCRNSKYQARQELLDDMELMAHNAELYNTAQSIVAVNGRKLVQMCRDRMADHAAQLEALEAQVEEENRQREIDEQERRRGKGKGKGKGKKGRATQRTSSGDVAFAAQGGAASSPAYGTTSPMTPSSPMMPETNTALQALLDDSSGDEEVLEQG